MKTKMIIAIAATMMVGTSANAACMENNLAGVYKNKRGDRFQIVQPNCESLTVVDLQNDTAYSADFKNPRNPLDMGNINSIPAVISRTSPMTFSIKKGFDYPSDNSSGLGMDLSRDALTVDFMTRPRVKKGFLPDAVSSPLIQFEFALIPFRHISIDSNGHVSMGPPTTKPESIFVGMVGITAIEEHGASLAQQVFNRGVKFGIDLLARLLVGGRYKSDTDTIDYFAKMAGESLDFIQ